MNRAYLDATLERGAERRFSGIIRLGVCRCVEQATVREPSHWLELGRAYGRLRTRPST